MPGDATSGGPVGTPQSFNPGYAGNAGNAATADRAEYSENPGKLEGKNASELGQEITKGTCPAKTANYANLSEARLGTNMSFTREHSCWSSAHHDVCDYTTYYYCDGTSWKLQGIETR